MTGRIKETFGYVEVAAAVREAMDVCPYVATSVHDRPQRVRYPDFLVIGAQRAGTTWLHDNLKSHPEVWLPPIKELNYFNQVYQPSPDKWESSGRIEQAIAIKRYFDAYGSLPEKYYSKRAALDEIFKNECTDEWYGRIFSHAGDDQICGEISPDYAILPRAAIARIVSLNPSVKVVLILRDPIARAWSNARRDAAGMGDADPVSLLLGPNWARVMQGRSNYPAIIKRWAGIVSPSRMIVVPYDSIAADPLGLLDRLCSFLSIYFDARLFADSHKIVRGETLLADIPDDGLRELRTRMRYIYDGLMDTYPEIAAPWVHHHYGESN